MRKGVTVFFLQITSMDLAKPLTPKEMIITIALLQGLCTGLELSTGWIVQHPNIDPSIPYFFVGLIHCKAIPALKLRGGAAL